MKGITGRKMAPGYRFFSIVAVLLPLTLSANEAGSISDVTSDLDVQAAGFRQDLETGELVQLITVTNRSGRPLNGGPIGLVISDLPEGVSVSNGRPAPGPRHGKERGSELRVLPVSSRPDRAGLHAGESLKFIVRFKREVETPLRYKTRFVISELDKATD